jgi:hypothetical protein
VADDPSLGELGRKIEDFRRDVRDDFSHISTRFDKVDERLERFVLKEVFEAYKAAQAERLGRLEREQETSRNAARAAIYAAVGSIVATVLAAILLSQVLRGH